MSALIVPDTSVLGLLVSSPLNPPVAASNGWASRMSSSRTIPVIPAISLYELRRELLRIQASSKLNRLKNILQTTRFAEVTPEAWRKAAEFWALVRSQGRPTADPHALDGDAILAGVAATIGFVGDMVTIATTNVGHLSRFPGVDARRWEMIS